MTWSLSEVEGLARKATYGTGLPWGIAEEAGKVTRWLAAARLPGPDALAQLLVQTDGRSYATRCPTDPTKSTWSAEDGHLCPLSAGAALCDQAEIWTSAMPLTLLRVAHPMLLMPYVVMAADVTKTSVCISWPGSELSRTARGTFLNASDHALLAPQAETVQIAPTDTASGHQIKRSYRCTMPETTAEILTRFAHRTYAPDTPASRLAGAGAGLSDND